MRFAYADPPYLGSSRKHYRDHPEHAVYDTFEGHRQLINRLCREFSDGWALSMASKNLHTLLPWCPPDVRVMAWVKPYTTFFPNVNPSWSWEPVIVRGGRNRRGLMTVRDYVMASSPAQNGRGFVGRKPEAFCFWLFDVLGAEVDDEFVDLFPGSGNVQGYWEAWCRTPQLPLVAVRQEGLFDA